MYLMQDRLPMSHMLGVLPMERRSLLYNVCLYCGHFQLHIQFWLLDWIGSRFFGSVHSCNESKVRTKVQVQKLYEVKVKFIFLFNHHISSSNCVGYWIYTSFLCFEQKVQSHCNTYLLMWCSFLTASLCHFLSNSVNEPLFIYCTSIHQLSIGLFWCPSCMLASLRLIKLLANGDKDRCIMCKIKRLVFTCAPINLDTEPIEIFQMFSSGVTQTWSYGPPVHALMRGHTSYWTIFSVTPS